MMTTAISTNSTLQPTVIQAEAIPPITAEEAAQVAAFELSQVLALLEQLHGEDWTQSTACTEWDVQAMTAHLAGGCAGWASLRHFLRQTILNPYIRQMAVPIDAINRREVEDRAHNTPQQLIDELRHVGPVAIRNRQNLPGLLRKIRISASPMPGKMSLAYLADVIYPRDQWMHRMDICHATGKPWASHPSHDKRLLDLVMRDMAQTAAGRYPVMVQVTGALNVMYHFSREITQAEIELDLFTLNRRASGRITADETLEMALIRGDRAVALAFLQNCEVLY